MKTTTTIAALIVCVCFAAAASAQNHQPSMMIRNNDGLVPSGGVIYTNSNYLGIVFVSHYDRGLKVSETIRGGAGETLGLEPGDIIIGAEGYYVDSISDLESAMRTSFGEITVTVKDVRTGRWVNGKMTLGSNGGGVIGTAVGYDSHLGVGIEMLYGGRNKITSVEPNSPASRLGLTVGDIITSTTPQGNRVTFTYIDAETGLNYTAWYEDPSRN